MRVLQPVVHDPNLHTDPGRVRAPNRSDVRVRPGHPAGLADVEQVPLVFEQRIVGAGEPRRLLPGEEIADVLLHYQRLLDLKPELDAFMEAPMIQDPALETPADDPIVSCAASVLSDLRLQAEPLGVPYGSDASKLARAGVPSVIFGPGSIDQAHGAVEWVECEQVEQALEFYRGVMLRFE